MSAGSLCYVLRNIVTMCTVNFFSLSSKQFHSCPFKYEIHRNFPSSGSSPFLRLSLLHRFSTSTVDSRSLPHPFFLSYLTTRICILNAVVEWIWAQKGGWCCTVDMEVKGLCCRIVRCDLDKHSCCSGRLETMPSFPYGFLPLGVASCCASIQLVLYEAFDSNKVSIR
jgi:hypothetical protein